MKFSETEGTDINYKKHNLGQFSVLLLLMFICSIQTTFANDLNLYTNQGVVIAITDLGGDENLFFNGVLEEGVLEATQTDPLSFVRKPNSDGTGVESNSDGTGRKSNSDGTGGESNSDGTGGESNSDGTGLKSNSDGTGSPESLLTIIIADCNNQQINLAYGIVQTNSGTTTIEFENVYMDGELMTCYQ